MLFESFKYFFQRKPLAVSKQLEFFDLRLGVEFQELVKHYVATSSSEKQLSICHFCVNDLSSKHVLANAESLQRELEVVVASSVVGLVLSACICALKVITLGICVEVDVGLLLLLQLWSCWRFSLSCSLILLVCSWLCFCFLGAFFSQLVNLLLQSRDVLIFLLQCFLCPFYVQIAFLKLFLKIFDTLLILFKKFLVLFLKVPSSLKLFLKFFDKIIVVLDSLLCNSLVNLGLYKLEFFVYKIFVSFTQLACIFRKLIIEVGFFLKS